jgi:hypothetical protein
MVQREPFPDALVRAVHETIDEAMRVELHGAEHPDTAAKNLHILIDHVFDQATHVDPRRLTETWQELLSEAHGRADAMRTGQNPPFEAARSIADLVADALGGARARVTRVELIALINAELADTAECPDGRVTGGLYRLRKPDSFGCNWSDSIIFSPAGNAQPQCLNALRQIVPQARERYNVLP